MELKIRNPSVPYVGSFTGSLRPNTTIHIKGYVNSRLGKCDIDFKTDSYQDEKSAKILHLSLRPSESAIIRNSFERGSWGHEERSVQPQLKVNERFIISITADQSYYKLTFNYKHFSNFHHRMPLYMAQFFTINGDVTIEEIKTETPPEVKESGLSSSRSWGVYA